MRCFILGQYCTIMWLLLAIYFGTGTCLVSGLEENNLCPEQERFTVNITQMVLRKMTVRNYKWCVNVPPRCSYYTEEQRYVPEVLEKEEFRMVNNCCPGFKKNESMKICIFDCANCHNGQCGHNDCICNPGFSGTYCDNGCPDTRWGSNCVNQCSCTKGNCNPITGYCSCPPGWKGSRCEYQMENFFRKKEVSVTNSSELVDLKDDKTSMNMDNLVKSLTKHSERAHYPTFQKYYTFLVTTLKSSPLKELDQFKFDEYQLPQSTSSYDVTTASSLLEIKSVKHSNFEYTQSHVKNLSTESRLKADMVHTIPYESGTKREENVINNTTDQVISVTQVSNIIMKEKAMDDIEVSVTDTQNVVSEDILLNSQSDADIESNLSTPQNETPFNNTHLIFSIGAAAGIIATIILIIAVTVFTTQNYKRNKLSGSIVAIASNSKKGNGDRGISAVAIFTRSVFHTPLPDPPSFQIPVFTTPSENIQSTGGSLETRVVCSMHLPNPSNYNQGARVIDEFYDHPPSTGSYRAASIPEPPEQILVSSLSKEHLYDEIPCWKQPLSVTESINTLPVDTFSYYANSIPHKNKLHK